MAGFHYLKVATPALASLRAPVALIQVGKTRENDKRKEEKTGMFTN